MVRPTDSRDFSAQSCEWLRLRHSQRVLLQLVEVHPFQRRNVRGVQVNARSHACVEGFFPARHAQTPAVARAQSGKTILRRGRRQIVALGARELQKFVGHHGADEVQAEVVFAGVATAIAQKSGQRVAATFAQRLAQNIGSGSRYPGKPFKVRANLS